MKAAVLDIVALESALEPGRYEELCRSVTDRLPLKDAEHVLALMGAASRAQFKRDPEAQLSSVLGFDIREPVKPKPFDWQTAPVEP